MQTFRGLKPSLGPARSCLHGVHLAPRASSRVAALDLDSTLIKSAHARPRGEKRATKTTNGPEWEWWRNAVPQKLKEADDSGYVACSSSNHGSGTDSPLTVQVLYRADLESESQVGGAYRLEEKDPPNRCCRACPPQRQIDL